MDPNSEDAGLGGRQLDATRRWHLGGPRGAATFCVFESPMLGGVGSGAASGQQAQSVPRFPASRLGTQSDPRNHHEAGGGIRSAGLLCNISAPTPWMPPI